MKTAKLTEKQWTAIQMLLSAHCEVGAYCPPERVCWAALKSIEEQTGAGDREEQGKIWNRKTRRIGTEIRIIGYKYNQQGIKSWTDDAKQAIRKAANLGGKDE